MNNYGIVYWITGLSGAGKTTLGTLLFNHLKEKNSNVIFLDGDILRTVFKSNDYTYEGRRELGFQYSALCKMLSEQGINVVICTIAMYDSIRQWNRENIRDYFEIFVEVEIDELIRRDQKGLYSGALRHEISNVMGIDLDYEKPKHPNLVLENSGKKTPKEQLDIMVRAIDQYMQQR